MPTRPADRPGQARTRLARAAVIDAARTLFVERGYGATTIEAISAAADVPQATVYRLFSSKRGILKAILDVSIAGDDQPMALPQRPQVQTAVAESDPKNQVAGFVAVAADVNARTAPIYGILVSAAGSDPDAAALLDDLNRQRRAGQGQLVRALDRVDALRPGLRRSEAADIVYTLMSPDVYRLLVVERGWSTKRYERWLTQTLADSLLHRAR
ncbi:TetR/AcrR family transcriptional regulator [Mycolicibacterium pulveris]|uniref:DNA-binding protein n=1 Tax=Mycolicibacterium pulveris TaxID=36813 RepID=A0A7I7UJP8_MYCPV|nr:TetR/AcrR family transcriptional regulator [Mycolicibacterium pulveris]MCV6980110.1 TetR/AcrR family transcriptional regulator [Mycolicibacterium pulveris]BBY81487.1 DNA-binding protein [Mycolicibacterium pulveris]